MKNAFVIHAAVLVLFMSAALPAESRKIPVLPSDPAVSWGVLPNGMSYYVAVNPSAKGFADFALVQRTGTGTVPDSLSCTLPAMADCILDSLPHFVKDSPAVFLAGHGCGPGRDGFVSVSEDATIYRFSDVMLSCETVVDSVLLMITDIAAIYSASSGALSAWYAPSDQAVIVCGDVDAEAISAKLRMLSYMCTAGESLPREEYEWKDSRGVEFVNVAETFPGQLSEVSLTWRSPRTPKKYMNTVQPAVYDITADELALIARERIVSGLTDMDIPFADVSCVRYGGLYGPADEHFRVSVSVSPADAREAFEIIVSSMSALDSEGTSKGEFRMSAIMCLDKLAEAASAPLKMNREYVDRCAASFLYNGTLASAKEKLDFHRSRNVRDTTMLRLFRRISSAVIDGKGNLEVVAEGMPDTDLRHVFDSVWHASPGRDRIRVYSPDPADTVSFPGMGPKVKVRSVKKEHTSGGEIWTFTNGFKVVYKKMDTSGEMYYMLAMNGGYGGVPGLGRGEGAFMSDYPELCYISGLKGRDFKKLLRSMGVTMHTEVNLTGTMVSGKAPKKRMQLLLRSLLAFSNERRPDSTAFSHYLRSERLRLEKTGGSHADVAAIIDSLICPDYGYSSFKSAADLNAGTAGKAEELFSSLSSKMNDGVLVLVGDMDETALKKLLCSYVGGFRTRDSAFRRPYIRYQPLSGWLTYSAEGMRDGMFVAMSARLPMTAENYMAAPVAAMVLEKGLTEAFAGTGVSLDVSYSCKIYPEERFSVMVSVTAPDGIGSLSLLGTVRSVLAGLSESCAREQDIALYKEYVKNCLALEMSGPEYWGYVMALRYLEGKDFTTGYASRIDALTPEKIRSLISMLDKGAKVEYVVKKK